MVMHFQLSDILAVLALVIAGAAWLRARGGAARIRAVHEALWELRYQYGELRAQITREEPAALPSEAPAPARPADGFIPLQSLKR